MLSGRYFTKVGVDQQAITSDAHLTVVGVAVTTVGILYEGRGTDVRNLVMPDTANPFPTGLGQLWISVVLSPT